MFPAAVALPDKPPIAVLPFTNMSGDAEQDYFCDGLVEDIGATKRHTLVVRFILKIPTDAVPQRQNSVGALGNAGQHVIESHH